MSLLELLKYSLEVLLLNPNAGIDDADSHQVFTDMAILLRDAQRNMALTGILGRITQQIQQNLPDTGLVAADLGQDEADIRELIGGILEDEGYETRLAS